MSDVLSFRIDGLRELDTALRELHSKIAAKWVNAALLAGVKPIRTAARGDVPVKTGALQKSIRVTRGKAKDDNRRDYYVIAGKRVKGGGGTFYAHFVERGTKPHDIFSSKGKMMFFGGSYAFHVKHPGATAKPYLEPAFLQQHAAALNAFAESLRRKLNTAGLLNPATE